MTDEELKEKLQYIIDHGMFRAVEDGMWCPFSEILNRIEELEAKIFQMDPQCAKNDPLINGGTNDDG